MIENPTAADLAYTERNILVAVLAQHAIDAGGVAGVIPHEGDPFDEGWNNVVSIRFSDGSQASWHFHDREAQIFGFLPHYDVAPERLRWDGHTTSSKYQKMLDSLPYPKTVPSASDLLNL